MWKSVCHSKFFLYFRVNSCPIDALSVSSLNQTKVFVFLFETLAWFRVVIKSPYGECFICVHHACNRKTVVCSRYLLWAQCGFMWSGGLKFEIRIWSWGIKSNIRTIMTTSWGFCDIKCDNMGIHIAQTLAFSWSTFKMTKWFLFAEIQFSLRQTMIFMLGSWSLETQRRQVFKSHLYELWAWAT